MQLRFGQETPHVMNVGAEGIGTISRYVWYPELHPHITCLLGPGKRNVLEINQLIICTIMEFVFHMV